MVPGKLRRSTLDDFVVRIDRTLSLLESWGLGVRQGRFRNYAAAIRRVLAKPLPTIVPADESAILVEAVNQCHQLADAVSMLADCSRPALLERLRQVLRGSVLPEEGTANDKPRDYLFELAAAAHFKDMLGCRIELPLGRCGGLRGGTFRRRAGRGRVQAARQRKEAGGPPSGGPKAAPRASRRRRR